MKPEVLVTRRIYPEAIHYLEGNFLVDYNGTDDVLSQEQILERAKGKAAIVCQLTDKFGSDLVGCLDGIKILANVAVGFDNIDIPAATAQRILVSNTPDVLTETTADFAFALLMATARRMVEGHHFVHSGEWRRWSIDMLVGHDVFGRTLGVFGMGRIGQALARRASGFSMRILYHDRVRAPETLEDSIGLEFVTKEELLRQADYISLHVPLLDATRHLIGAPELQQMKPNAILINTSRGPVVDEAALVAALEARKIAGAGLDVFEREPEVHPGLLKLANVTLAPHIASASIDTRRRMSMMAAENAVAAIQGRRAAQLAQCWLVGVASAVDRSLKISRSEG